MNDVQINPDDILEQYGNLVYHLALSQMKNRTDAEDVFQEVFLRLVRKDRTFESNEHIKAWLIRVTVNCSHSLWHSAWKQKVVPPRKNAGKAQTFMSRFQLCHKNIEP